MSAPPIQTNPPIPLLKDGDRLTRDEFERRYDAMPRLHKAELIEGVVYMPSPVRAKHHGNPHAALIGWLVNYWAYTSGVLVADNATIRLDVENEPQPDGVLYVEPSRGGQVQIGPDDCIEGGPDWVGEVSASSASIDLTNKFRVYQRNNVREYVVWRVLDDEIDWFVSRNGNFVRLPLTSGVYRSEVFPGLWLDPQTLIRFDMAQMFQVAQAGWATPEHAAFVASLQKKP
jgi:Uma2 family endonuclease